LTPQEVGTFQRAPQQQALPLQPPKIQRIRRLAAGWQLPEPRPSVAWDGADRPAIELHEPTFEWVGESLRLAGTVVHALLQRSQSPDDPLPAPAAIRKMLAHAGVTRIELDSMTARVAQALTRIQASTRGRWILEPHQDSGSEYAVTGVVDGEVVRGQVDRTFVDGGVRWIIDFKTSTHEGTGLEGFLDEQQRRYRDQMERYARILEPLGLPVRLGLYFPLLDEWREWARGS